MVYRGSADVEVPPCTVRVETEALQCLVAALALQIGDQLLCGEELREAVLALAPHRVVLEPDETDQIFWTEPALDVCDRVLDRDVGATRDVTELHPSLRPYRVAVRVL